MSLLSGPGGPDLHLVTVAELLQTDPPLCCSPGPAWSKCVRASDHPQPCAALGTDGHGVPVVVTWYRPSSDAWPLSAPAGRHNRAVGEPGG